MSDTIVPRQGMIDEPRAVRVTGLAPGEARMVTSLRKSDGSYWASVAVFAVGESGDIDLGRDAPIAGDWRAVDPMAMVWSMRNVRRAVEPRKSPEPDERTVLVTVTDAAGTVRHGAFSQSFLAPGVRREAIAHPDLVGEVFHPAGPGPHPVILGLNGSNGGMPLQRCALYAAAGYTAVALAYFNAPGRPTYFSDIPLEYFGAALEWITQSLKPKDDFIAVAGSSRGGELAMLLGAYFPDQVRAVVGFVPSAVVNGVQQSGPPDLPRDHPAWLWKGRPVPNLWQGNPDADVSRYTTPDTPGAPIRQSRIYAAPMGNAEFLERARIPVEKITGPVFMVSGGDDGSWPSAVFCSMIEERLRGAGHPWPVTHVSHPRAGHAFSFPFEPVEPTVGASALSGLLMDRGGTVEANAENCRLNWPKVMDFLRQAPELYRKGVGKAGG